MSLRALLRRLAAVRAGAHLALRIAPLLAIAASMATGASAATAQAAPLVGSDVTQTFTESTAPGTARAFRYTANAAGSVEELNVYADATSSATAIQVALYTNANERPRARLTACTVSAPRTGWNACVAPAAAVSAGTKYWLAILAPAGTTGRLAFRDRPRDGAVSYQSSSTGLASLPATFSVGTKRNGYSPASIYGATTTVQPDTTAPSVPTGLARTAATETTVALAWAPSTDAVGVSGYRVYRDGVLASASSATSAVVSGLACGTSYTFAVEAYDAAGNTSARATLTTGTAACPAAAPTPTPAPAPAPAPDSVPPSVPQDMRWTGVSQTAIDLAWSASTDDVGVAGYRLYRDGTAVGTTAGTSYSVSGLSCGTSYTIALEAYDAAGNASNRAEATGTTSTAACASATPTPTPTPTPAPEPAPSPAPEPSPSPVPATAANIWVDVSGGTCADSSTLTGYSDAAACGSLDAANDTCEAGDVVLVRGGSYGAQTISGSNGRTAQCQVLVAEGETVMIGGALNFAGAGQIRVDGGGGRFGANARLRTTLMGSRNTLVPENQFPANISNGSRAVTLEGADFGGWLIIDSRNAIVRNNDIGPCNSYDGQDPGASGQAYCDNGSIEYCEVTELQCAGYNEGHLIEGNRIHDFNCDDSFFNGMGSDDCHWECMYVSYPRDTIVRGNVFANCANGGNIFHTFSNGGGSFTADYGYTNYTVENNVFEQSCNNRSAPCGGRLDTASGIGHCGIYSGNDLTNVKIRFNTFIGGSTFALDTACSQASGNGLQIVGNLMKHTSVTCGVGWTPEYVTHNLYSGNGGTCGANAITAGSTFANLIVSDTNGGDAHLRGAPGSTIADDRVPVTVRGGCPTTDIDGQPRPSTGSCNAGADER